MSNQTYSAVAEQSTKTYKGMFAVAAIATATLGAVFAFSPAAQALSLDNVNLGTNASTQDGSDEWSSIGFRIATQDGLENLGIGTSLQNVDGDENQKLDVGLEATDDLDNIVTGVNASNTDGDESQNLGVGAALEDGLDNVSTSVDTTTVDGDKKSNFGIGFSFDE